MTLGDILAVIAAILTVGAAWVATILLVVLAFPARVAGAQAKLTGAPGRCAGQGFGVALGIGLLAAICANGPGPVKGVSLVLLGALGATAALGSAAVVRFLGGRIDVMGSPMAPFASLTRASALYVASGFLPVIGWFFVMPVALLLSVGSGVASLWPEKKPKVVSPSPNAFVEPVQ